jgi:Fe2+ or Zn2+ uptake regulation protein
MKERRTKSDITEIIPVAEAKAYEAHCLTELRAAGYRITMPRVQVIRALANSHVALSAYAIHARILELDGKIDVVSIYRIVATLQEVGLIHHIGVVDGYFPCRQTDCRSRRSEVLVCERCERVYELPLPASVTQTIEEQVRLGQYALSGIKVELTASSCPKCKGKK